jgi:alpha-beta hydrolase superfamily lysophospholipase
MKWIIKIVIGLAMSGSLMADIRETSVQVAEGVKGNFVLPGKDVEAADRVVLLYHGWTGKMDEVGDLYKRLAHQLGEAGIASLRIDFRGEGERNGHRLTSTFATRIADGEAALAFVQKELPKAKVGIVGFSLGGATALAVTGRNATKITSLVLWSSSGNLGADFFTDPNMINGQREAVEK